MKAVRLSVLSPGRLYSSDTIMNRIRDLRVVAQCLNQLHHRGPPPPLKIYLRVFRNEQTSASVTPQQTSASVTPQASLDLGYSESRRFLNVVLQATLLANIRIQRNST